MGNPFVHVELNTTNLSKAKAFYAKLFDWKLQDLPADTPGGEYTMIKVGKGVGGGMMKQMIPGAGSAWMPYVLVKDIDAATKKAKKLRARSFALRVLMEMDGACARGQSAQVELEFDAGGKGLDLDGSNLLALGIFHFNRDSTALGHALG